MTNHYYYFHFKSPKFWSKMGLLKNQVSAYVTKSFYFLLANRFLIIANKNLVTYAFGSTTDVSAVKTNILSLLEGTINNYDKIKLQVHLLKTIKWSHRVYTHSTRQSKNI